ncbi:MAG: hypothetical protein M5U28_13105 [Sandaracinaceae bacterium]|nr:hypothetical protein [Sandaracinaceae bacterium]
MAVVARGLAALGQRDRLDEGVTALVPRLDGVRAQLREAAQRAAILEDQAVEPVEARLVDRAQARALILPLEPVLLGPVGDEPAAALGGAAEATLHRLRELIEALTLEHGGVERLEPLPEAAADEEVEVPASSRRGRRAWTRGFRG